MNIAIICLAVAFAGVLIWCYHLNGQVDELIDMMTDMAMHVTEREDWENDVFEKIDRKIGDNNDYSKRLDAVNEELRKLTDKVEEFDGLSADSIRAQIDSEKAWAEGVRAIAGYGMNVPKIDTKGLSNE